MIGRETGSFEHKKTSGDYLNYSIVEIGKNTENNPRHLRRLVVTQTPEEKKTIS